MNANTMQTAEALYVSEYEDQFRARTALEKFKDAWEWIRKFKLWAWIGRIANGICCLLFVSPPAQTRIEEARAQAMQYRGIF